MEVSITRFRRDLFELVKLAMQVEQISVIHKGERFRIVPDVRPDRFSRLTRLQVVAPETDLDVPDLKREMAQAWEKDWSDL